MGESIRSLIIKLGYDIDTTGANIFRSSFKNLQKDLKKSASTKGFEDAFVKNLKTSGNRISSRVKKIFAITAATIAATIAAATKVFVSFSGVEQARLTLAFRTSQKEADTIIERIAKITKETGGYVTQLDALNAVSFGGNITDQMGFFIDNLDKIIKLSKVAGKDFGETSNAIARFIETGTGLESLVEFEIISAKQKEALEKSGAAELIGRQGITARTAQASEFLRAGSAKVDEFFEKFRKTGGATIDKLQTTIGDTVIVLGEKLNPAVNKAATVLEEFVEGIKRKLKEEETIQRRTGEGSVLEGIRGDLDRIIFGPSGGKTRSHVPLPIRPVTPKPEEGGFLETLKRITGFSTSTDNSTTIINVPGAGDPELVARMVEAKIAKRVIRNSVRRETPQALNTKIQPATSR